MSTTFGTPGGYSSREIALWTSAALVVLAAHVGGGLYLHGVMDQVEPPAAFEQAMEVDLSPVMMSAPDQVESEEVISEETEQPVVEEEPVDQPPPEEQAMVAEDVPPETVEEEQEPVQPEMAEPEQAEPEPVQPDVVTEEPEETVVDLPESDVPMPMARPEPPREIVQEERPRPQPRRERPREQPVREQPVRQAQARQQESSQQEASRAPQVSPARWATRVRSLIERQKRRAGRGVRDSGQAVVAFSVSASGAVTGVRLARSSGSSAIDQAALAMVQAISPPPPPGGSAVPLTVPVLFD